MNFRSCPVNKHEYLQMLVTRQCNILQHGQYLNRKETQNGETPKFLTLSQDAQKRTSYKYERDKAFIPKRAKLQAYTYLINGINSLEESALKGEINVYGTAFRMLPDGITFC
ncbi:hypothetical protein ACF0H5_008927 [Mactra antiquata]